VPSCSHLSASVRSIRLVQRLQLHIKPAVLRSRGSHPRRVMVAARQEAKSRSAETSSLAALDRSLSTAVFRNIGAQIPRPALMLFEHAGNGLFCILSLVTLM
jgi:hypothetical protein